MLFVMPWLPNLGFILSCEKFSFSSCWWGEFLSQFFRQLTFCQCRCFLGLLEAKAVVFNWSMVFSVSAVSSLCLILSLKLCKDFLLSLSFMDIERKTGLLLRFMRFYWMRGFGLVTHTNFCFSLALPLEGLLHVLWSDVEFLGQCSK